MHNGSVHWLYITWCSIFANDNTGILAVKVNKYVQSKSKSEFNGSYVGPNNFPQYLLSSIKLVHDSSHSLNFKFYNSTFYCGKLSSSMAVNQGTDKLMILCANTIK